MRPIFDGHLDVAMNALFYDRDVTRPVAELREREATLEDDGRGRPTTSLPAMREAGVAVCLSTLIARAKPIPPGKKPARSELDFRTQEIAHASAMGQLAYYRVLERQGRIRILTDRRGLDEHWGSGTGGPLGVILTMEGADPIVEPGELRLWHQAGLRTLMLAHFGPSAYAMRTRPADRSLPEGPLTPKGRALLAEMSSLRMPLDLTHLCDESLWEAIGAFDGRIYASHSNCRALADTLRQLPDEAIRRIAGREGVVGIALYWKMLKAGPGVSAADVDLETVADHVDRVCQVSGSARHVALGTDLDGGFGAEATPRGIDTVADVHRLEDVLVRRGHGDEVVAGFFHANWLRFWREGLPC